MSRSKRKKRLNLKGITLIVIFLFLIMLIPISLSSGGYKTVMKTYCKSIVKQDYEKYKSVFPQFVTDNGLENILLFAYDTGDNYMQEIYNSYVDKYGDNVKISCKINNRIKLTQDELKEYSQSATAQCTDGSEIKIKKGYNLDISLKCTGKNSSDTEELSVVVIKYDGNWYIYSGDINYC